MINNIIGRVLHATQRYVNGPGTVKELTIYYLIDTKDEDGEFECSQFISYVIDDFLSEQELRELENRSIKIEIEVQP